jgi:hemerythrin-like domain-containing protein
MPDQRLLFLARDARDRAEEIFAKAENFKDADAKQKMHEIAEKYMKLAEQLEQAVAD